MKCLRAGLSFTVLIAALSAAMPASAAQMVKRGQVNGRIFYFKDACPAVPAGQVRCLSQIITDARGNPLQRPLRRAPKMGGGAFNTRTMATTPQDTPIAPAGNGLTPADLRSAYKITGNGTSSMTIAVVGIGTFSNVEEIVNTYREAYGFPDCTTASGCFKQVDKSGNAISPSRSSGTTTSLQESAADLELISAMCPNCKLILADSDSGYTRDLNVLMNRLKIAGANIVSISLAGPEQGNQPYEAGFSQANLPVLAASGDYGYQQQNGKDIVNFPSSYPAVTAVGGTTLTPSSNTRGWSETAWGDDSDNAATSGCSQIYAKPGYQTDPLCANRTVADVSAAANGMSRDGSLGISLYLPLDKTRPDAQAWQTRVGTSLSTPIIAGVVGNAGVAYTSATPYAHRANLFDAIGGSTGSCGGTYLCTGVRGYDGPTGLGTPNGTGAF